MTVFAIVFTLLGLSSWAVALPRYYEYGYMRNNIVHDVSEGIQDYY